MGYTTDFEGEFTITPALNEHEVAYLTRFAETRRMDRVSGPYFVGGTGEFGQGPDDDIRDYNKPPEGQPGLWCQWVPTEEGAALIWDEGEKAYYMDKWIVYIIDHFLRPGAQAQASNDPQFEHFTFDHMVNGTVYASGEDYDDLWAIRIKDNDVRIFGGHIVYRDDDGNALEVK